MTRRLLIPGAVLALLLWLSPARGAATEDHEKVFELVRGGQLKLLRLMIFDPDELNAMRTTWGSSLLHEAASNRQTDVVIWLLQNHCDVNVRNGSNLTPLSFACGTHSLELVKVLVQNGADIEDLDGEGGTLLHAVAAQGSPEMIDYALGLKLDLNRVDDNGRTPLICAADHLNVDTTRELLAHVPLLDLQDHSGRTALHHAAYPDNAWDSDNKYTVAQLLLVAGADPEATDDSHRLPCDRTDTWALYFLLAVPTASFQTHLLLALACSTILTAILVLVWRATGK